MELTEEQRVAYDTIIDAFRARTPALLSGSAGTGKTTLTKFISHYCAMHNIGVCGIAPTHKAAHVLDKVLNERSVMAIPVFTVASVLGKIKEHGFIGTKTYGGRTTAKLAAFHLFIVDEVSMISDGDMEAIVRYVSQSKKRLLLIGDDCQLPCPSAPFECVSISLSPADQTETDHKEKDKKDTDQKYTFGPQVLGSECQVLKDGTSFSKVLKDGTSFIRKKNSYVFDDAGFVRAHLSQIVRQAAGSYIIQLATYIRDHIQEDIPLYSADNVDHNPSNVLFPEDHFCPFHSAANLFKEKASQYTPSSVKLITYTNASVLGHNKEIRREMGIDSERLVVGEILMGYTNIGFPDLVIENGQDYLVTGLRETAEWTIAPFSNLHGTQMSVQLIGRPEKTNTRHSRLFVIHVNHPANYDFMQELIRRAKRVNRPRSTKTDYLEYMALKNMVLFMENLYSFEGSICSESSFREAHPLLFTSISECIQFQTNTAITSVKTEKIEQTYHGLISGRIADDKPFGESELFSDAFMVVEKDIYYGYAITSHKSQGSGYDCVIADEHDFQKVVEKWNNRHRCLESRVREKNQLRYVAFTRAKQELYIIK
jgi:hypothetical protein